MSLIQFYTFIANWIQFIIAQILHSKFIDIHDVNTARKLSWPPWWEPGLEHCCTLVRACWNNSPRGFSRMFPQAPPYKIPRAFRRLPRNISLLAYVHTSLLASAPESADSSALELCSSVRSSRSFRSLRGFCNQRNLHKLHYQDRPLCKWSHTVAHGMSTKNR